MELSNRCILAIGDTGNGKSFTATVFGAKNVTIGHSSKAGTTEITVRNVEKGGFYIDTLGFDDPGRKKDEEIIRDIYLKMLEKNIQNLTTILWFVKPDERATDSYQRQAKFIEDLSKCEHYNGNVWDNVIIATKGFMIFDGPREAAREIAQKEHNTKDDLLSKTPDFMIFLFEKLPEQNPYRRYTSSDELNEHGIFKESEPERILAKYESLMKGHLKHPIRLELKKIKCSKCSEETDPRFASPKCHEIKLFHPDKEYIHRGNIVDNHQGTLLRKHPGGFASPKTISVRDHRFVYGLLGNHINKVIPGYYVCCDNHDFYSVGCKEVYSCCEKEKYQSSGCQKIYDGCGHQLSVMPCITICNHCKKNWDTIGCKERCRNCNNDNPRNNKGCTVTSHIFISG